MRSCFLLYAIAVNLLQAANMSPTESFFCNSYYDAAVKTLKSIRNDSIRLTVLNLTTPLTYDQASQVCQKCWDASLVTNDDVTQLQAYLPLWIGLSSKQNATTGINDHDWMWKDGARLNQWQKGYAQSILLPQNFESNTRYGIYAFPGNWVYENEYPRYHTYHYEKKKVVQRGDDAKMKWIALPSSTLLSGSVDLPAYDGLSNAEKDGLNSFSMKYIVCERPVRPKCHFWNYTEDSCQMSEIFGCHNYENAMFHREDDVVDKVSCNPLPHRRYAIPCACSNCTCHVTQWGQWSSCGSEVCSLEGQTRTRRREAIDSLCPPTYTHMKLEETENCTIPGCEALIASISSCFNTEKASSSTERNITFVDLK